MTRDSRRARNRRRANSSTGMTTRDRVAQNLPPVPCGWTRSSVETKIADDNTVRAARKGDRIHMASRTGRRRQAERPGGQAGQGTQKSRQSRAEQHDRARAVPTIMTVVRVENTQRMSGPVSPPMMRACHDCGGQARDRIGRFAVSCKRYGCMARTRRTDADTKLAAHQPPHGGFEGSDRATRRRHFASPDNKGRVSV